MPLARDRPLGVRVPDAIGEVDDPDDRAVLELVRGWRLSTCELLHGHVAVDFEGAACVDQEWATVVRGPTAVLDVLAAMDNRPGPGLTDGKHARVVSRHSSVWAGLAPRPS